MASGFLKYADQPPVDGVNPLGSLGLGNIPKAESNLLQQQLAAITLSKVVKVFVSRRYYCFLPIVLSPNFTVYIYMYTYISIHL